MTDFPAKCRVLQSAEANHSDVNSNGSGVTEDEPSSATEHIPAGARWTFFLLGCVILLPFNALANASPFFLTQLAGSPFYSTYNSSWSSANTVTKLVFQFYCTFTARQSSPSRRISTSLVGHVLVSISLCLCTFAHAAPSVLLVFALSHAAFYAIATARLTTAVYAVAALLDASFLRTVFSGQAAIAVAISAVQVVSSIVAIWSPKFGWMEGMAVGKDDQPEAIAARIVFGVSTLFFAVSLVAYTWMRKQSFYKLGTRILERHRGVGDPDERTGLLADGRASSSTTSDSHVYQVYKQNSIFMFSLAYVFAITLAVYPAITTRVRPVNQGIHPLLFTSFHFLVLNVGDLLGRYSTSFPYLVVWSAKKILAMSLLRTLFIPLVLLCNVERPTVAAPFPPVINSDIVFMIIVLMMGYTTGYVSSLALLAVSSVEHNPGLKGREDVDIAAALGSSFVILGFATGSLSSFGVQAIA